MTLHRITRPALFALALLAGQAHAQATAPVAVDGAWARATVQGQKATGAFMRLTAKDGARLVRAESPAAGVVEVHEMKMEGDIMKMRAIPALDLPAGKTVELKPGGKYEMATLDLRQGMAISPTLVRRLVRDAVALNQQLGNPTDAAK